jgi:hypothetical protein
VLVDRVIYGIDRGWLERLAQIKSRDSGAYDRMQCFDLDRHRVPPCDRLKFSGLVLERLG